MVSETKRKANNKWNEKNKEKHKYYQKKSVCKSFIKNEATKQDLEDLKQLIEEQEKDGNFQEKQTENDSK